MNDPLNDPVTLEGRSKQPPDTTHLPPDVGGRRDPRDRGGEAMNPVGYSVAGAGIGALAAGFAGYSMGLGALVGALVGYGYGTMQQKGGKP